MPKESPMQKFDTPDPISAVLEIPAGRIRFIAADRADTTVEVLPADASNGRDVKAAKQTTVGRLGGPAEISTLRGDVHIAEAVLGTVVLRTLAGEVSVGAARGVSASLDAGTTDGRIHNAFENTDGAAAGLHIHATTTHDGITARSL
jgi:hypothetical protein